MTAKRRMRIEGDTFMIEQLLDPAMSSKGFHDDNWRPLVCFQVRDKELVRMTTYGFGEITIPVATFDKLHAFVHLHTARSEETP